MNDVITNGLEIKRRIISEINKATQLICVAMAYFTDREIAMTIIEAKKRNVVVDIILSSNIQNEQIKLMLKGAGISVHAFETGDARGVMHHKFCLIDHRISINGSFNYSVNASTNNVENITVSDDSSIYSQFALEFERLKYKIDHQIAVSEKENALDINTNQTQSSQLNKIELFSKRLSNLVFSSVEFDTEKYRQQGYEDSKESSGNIDIFRTKIEAISERIKAHATDEGLGSVKNVLSTKILSAYEDTKSAMEMEKEGCLNREKQSSEFDKRSVLDKVEKLKQSKTLLESGNPNTGERGLLDINKDIEKNKLSRRSIEGSMIIKSFWTGKTILNVIGIVLFVFYLSVFFASAIYKVFFEGNVIRNQLENGTTPELPPLIDANAILEIFTGQGVLFGLIAMFFFLIPLAITNVELIGCKVKWLNNLCKIGGLIIFDIVVAFFVVDKTDEIQSLLKGQDSTFKMWEVFIHAEFYIILMFGMIPLFITGFFIKNTVDAYNSSQRYLVDELKNKQIEMLDLYMIDFNAERELISSQIKEKENVLIQLSNEIQDIERESANRQREIENKHQKILDQIRSIHEDYLARISSGKLFIESLFNDVSVAYKSGFVDFLPEFYSVDQVANRVKEIDQVINVKA